jgi:hypothetical protein
MSLSKPIQPNRPESLDKIEEKRETIPIKAAYPTAGPLRLSAVGRCWRWARTE